MSGYPDDVVFSPDRVLHPLRRTGKKGEGRFERVSWDDAPSARSAGRLKEIVAEHGPTAVLPYSYAGTEGKIQGESLAGRFFARLGASRLQRDVCGSAAHHGLTPTIGTSTGILPADLVHSRFILVWGANPAVSNEHGWDFALEAKKKGARIVVVDPLRSRTAAAGRPPPAAATRHRRRPRPGDDERHRPRGAARRGLRRAAHRGLRPAPLRGSRVPAGPGGGDHRAHPDEIVELARSYATTRPAAIRLMIGMEHHGNGANTFRTLACLPALVGAWRERGGGLVEFTGRPVRRAC